MTFDDEQAREWLDDLDAMHDERLARMDRALALAPADAAPVLVQEHPPEAER